MPCRDCQHFVSSAKANQRAWLEGYGYCGAAPTVMQRARFFNDGSTCWLIPQRFQERKP